MATLKICIQKQRKDGLYPVYIRVIHRRKVAYIKTDKMVSEKGLSRKKEITDPYVLNLLSSRVLKYIDMLNRVDCEGWSVKDITVYLTKGIEDVCFSDYARSYCKKLNESGRYRASLLYNSALRNLESFANSTHIMTASLTSQFVSAWIEHLSSSKRAKESYPTCIRKIFNTAQDEYNDYDNGIIRIKTNPWIKVKIPTSDTPQKLAITPDACRAFFAAPIPDNNSRHPKAELARDVAMISFCLAGMNAVDIYSLPQNGLSDGIVRYKRSKTTSRRLDGAYIEVKVPLILYSLLEKYKAKDDDEHFFNFAQRFSSSGSFSSVVDKGIAQLCVSINAPRYCLYTFRHTWATVAQNDCNASLADIGFAMGHSAGNTVTRGYIKTDFSRAWELNEKVVDFIFFSDAQGAQKPLVQKDATSIIGTKQLLHGVAYYRGSAVADITNTGYHNVDEIIADLEKLLPNTLPCKAKILYRITNIDKNEDIVREKNLGKK